MKFIVVVGGVLSGVGKGVATASIGKILQKRGFSVTAVKIDPYINFDAGTLRPTEHGEVWVTDDGGEIDQDLGNYERFLRINIPKKNNITTGQIYHSVIDAERHGKYLGKTVQFIPHIIDEIKRRVVAAGKKDNGDEYDFVVVEIGGTIGDYENLPFLFAMKSLEVDLGKENVMCVLVSYLPVPPHVGEMKTKPTQQAIKMLNEHGIAPDFVLCRANKPLDDVRKNKIKTYANMLADHIISAPDITTIYRIPLNFEKEDLGNKILDIMKIQPKQTPDWSEWKKLVNNIENPSKQVNIAMVGKYVDIGDFSLADSYVSINNALMHTGAHLDAGIKITWIDAKELENNHENLNKLSNYDGVIVPGGFGASGVEGKIAAIKYARENNIPFLGLCYGLQLAVVEFSRNVCNLNGANTTENDSSTPNPVIDILEAQKSVLEESKYGATMRLGSYAAILDKGSFVYGLYKNSGRLEKDMERLEKIKKGKELFRLGFLEGDSIVLERHRHRYEVNPKFINIINEAGLVFSGFHHRADGTKLMEFIELPKHKFFVATQAHPEFKSRFGDPAPLFVGFVDACIKK
ncbi:CTP synthase [Candidatus Aenigmatarchaeota archaeon]